MSDSLRLNAYHYGFDATGVHEVDLILSAVAIAGKQYHHTEWWADDEDGESCAAAIQRVANDAAAEVGRLRADLADTRRERDPLADELGQVRAECEKLMLQ